MELEAKLRPFIPEYIPAIGEVDAFLKMPRPDPQ
jgi:intraflagellar transport protein 46